MNYSNCVCDCCKNNFEITDKTLKLERVTVFKMPDGKEVLDKSLMMQFLQCPNCKTIFTISVMDDKAFKMRYKLSSINKQIDVFRRIGQVGSSKLYKTKVELAEKYKKHMHNLAIKYNTSSYQLEDEKGTGYKILNVPLHNGLGGK